MSANFVHTYFLHTTPEASPPPTLSLSLPASCLSHWVLKAAILKQASSYGVYSSGDLSNALACRKKWIQKEENAKSEGKKTKRKKRKRFRGIFWRGRTMLAASTTTTKDWRRQHRNPCDTPAFDFSHPRPTSNPTAEPKTCTHTHSCRFCFPFRLAHAKSACDKTVGGSDRGEQSCSARSKIGGGGGGWKENYEWRWLAALALGWL